MTVLEISASAVITLSIFLAGRNSIHTWWTGIIGCLLFGVLFYQTKLYAEVVLQLFFVGASFYGWWQWLYGQQGHEKPVSTIGVRRTLLLLPLGLLVAGAYGLMLYYFTDGFAPFIDSGVLVFSVVAQWLMIQRRLESWIFWLIVNTLAVPLYASRELYVAACLYCAYWVNALVAYRHWRSLLVPQSQPEVRGADAA